MKDDAILDALLAGQVDPAEFRHRDHVAAALAALRRYEFFEATERYARALRALVAQAGVPEKYNATLTLIFMSLVAEAHEASPTADADRLLTEHPALRDVGAVRARYSAGRLDAAHARRCVVLPDVPGAARTPARA